MTFWDSSALVALLAGEKGFGELRAALAADRLVAAWWGTKVEATSAVARARREAVVDDATALRLLHAADAFLAAATEVEPTEEVREAACRLLRAHALRSGDALQLAAALVWADHRPTGIGFVCLDQRLRAAAEWEGFDLLPR